MNNIEQWDNPSYVLSKIKENKYFLSNASSSLKDNDGFMRQVFNLEKTMALYPLPPCLQFASNRIKDDETLVQIAIQNNPHNFAFVSERLSDCEELAYEAVLGFSYNLIYASERLRDDYHFVKKAVEAKGSALIAASDRLRDNETIVAAAIQSCGTYIQYASARLRDDENLIAEAVAKNSFALESASSRLKSDKTFILKLLSDPSCKNKPLLQHVAPLLRDDEAVLRKAIANTWSDYVYASDRLKDFAVACVKKSHGALSYV